MCAFVCVHAGEWCKHVFLALGSSQHTESYCLGHPSQVLRRKSRFKDMTQDHRVDFWQRQKQSLGLLTPGPRALPLATFSLAAAPFVSLSAYLLSVTSIGLSFRKQNPKLTTHAFHLSSKKLAVFISGRQKRFGPGSEERDSRGCRCSHTWTEPLVYRCWGNRVGIRLNNIKLVILNCFALQKPSQ